MEHQVTSGGATISYEVDGPPDGPALLLINSIGSTREMWARQAPAFAGRYRVIRYDARGHGRSSAPAGDYTIAQLGGDALAILDALTITSAHVCGISLGGLTAQWLGVHAAGRVTKLIAANTAARIGTVESWNERITMVRDGGMSPVAARSMQIWFSPAFHERDPETVHGFRAMVQTTPVEGYLGCCAALRDADLREEIAKIAAPTLAVASSLDPVTPPEGLAFIRDRIPGARLVTLAGAHLSNVESAEDFTAAVVDFLD